MPVATTIADPFTYLTNDHREMERFLETLDNTTERAIATREQVFADLNDTLSLHADVEENVVYPLLEENPAIHDAAKEAYEEHKQVRTLLDEMSELPVDSEAWVAKLAVLKKEVEHHVQEEEGDMFQRAREDLNANDLRELAVEMEEYFETR